MPTAGHSPFSKFQPALDEARDLPRRVVRNRKNMMRGPGCAEGESGPSGGGGISALMS